MSDAFQALSRRLLPLAAAVAACAPKQRIPLDVGPGVVTVYLDSEKLESVPAEVELRADKGHVLFFRAEGYHRERVVLFSRQRDGKPHLEPAEVRVRMVPKIASIGSFEIQEEEP